MPITTYSTISLEEKITCKQLPLKFKDLWADQIEAPYDSICGQLQFFEQPILWLSVTYSDIIGNKVPHWWNIHTEIPTLSI